MIKTVRSAVAILAAGVAILASCSENLDDSYDPYENWQTRNEAWFQQLTFQARDSISKAKAAYPSDWEDHCNWRIYRSLFKSTSSGTGTLTDSIVVYINCNHLKAGYYPASNEGSSPDYTDSVCISYRGYLMATRNYGSDGQLEMRQERFASTYYGTDDDIYSSTTAPEVSCVNDFVDGFATALMYMVPGDDWTVYLPNNLAYGSSSSGLVQSYSTLQFRIFMYDWHEANYTVPVWKARQR